MKTVIDMIEKFKNHNGDAIIYKTDFKTFRWSYKKIYKHIQEFATLVKESGLKKGDKVLIWAPNLPEWVIVHLGTIYAGCVLVPADLLANVESVDKIAEDSKPKLIIKTNYKPALKYKAKTIFIEELEFILNELSKSGPVKTTEKDVIELVYTSGTTGKPKGVILTNKNIMSNVKDMTQHANIRASDRALGVLPLSHLFVQTCGTMAFLSQGGSLVFLSSIKPSALFDALKTENITVAVSVPRLLRSMKQGMTRKIENSPLKRVFPLMLKLAKKRPCLRKKLFGFVHRRFGKNFRFFVSGGAALDEDTETFWNYLGFTVLQGYGLSECSPVLTANTDKTQKIGSVGLPLKQVQLKIENGEVLAKGPNVFSGYYNALEKTKEVFRNGWFLTGDIGEFDDEGYLYIKGRKKDVIVTSNGVNVYPDDIEAVLNEMPAVAESCVIGLPVEHGEEIHVVLIIQGNTQAQKIIDAANAKLDSSQQILGFSLWLESEFPKTATMKIKKNLVMAKLKTSKPKTQSSPRVSKLALLLSQISKVPAERIKPSTRLTADLKIDSIGKVELVSAIERDFNMDFEEDLINAKTQVKNIEQIIGRKSKGSSISKYPTWMYAKCVNIVRAVFQEIINFNLFARIWGRIKVLGKENLKNLNEPVIFAANHISFMDHPLILAALPFRLRHKTAAPAWAEFFFPEKSSLMNKITKRIMYYYTTTTMGLYMMSQEHSFRNSLIHTGKLMEKGYNILIFPEGERTRTKKMLPLMNGTALLTQALRATIVPVGIRGPEVIFPRNATVPKFHNMRVSFGKPIKFKNESIIEINKKIKAEIEKLR